jgi:hypothetical protein
LRDLAFVKGLSFPNLEPVASTQILSRTTLRDMILSIATPIIARASLALAPFTQMLPWPTPRRRVTGERAAVFSLCRFSMVM